MLNFGGVVSKSPGGRPFHGSVEGFFLEKNRTSKPRSLQGTIEAQMKEGKLSETDTWSVRFVKGGW